MYKYFISFVFSFLLILGCKKEVQQQKITQKKPEMNTVINRKPYKKLNSYAKKQLESWKSFNNLSNYLKRFEKTSPNNALNNANELKDLLKEVKNNIPIADLKSPAFNARINVLENEVLRLVDMTLIPAITTSEVNTQIDKIFLVFSSVNAKINTVFEQKKLNNDINLDDFFKLDSTEIRKPKKKKSKLFEYDD